MTTSPGEDGNKEGLSTGSRRALAFEGKRDVVMDDATMVDSATEEVWNHERRVLAFLMLLSFWLFEPRPLPLPLPLSLWSTVLVGEEEILLALLMTVNAPTGANVMIEMTKSVGDHILAFDYFFCNASKNGTLIMNESVEVLN